MVKQKPLDQLLDKIPKKAVAAIIVVAVVVLMAVLAKKGLLT